VIKFYLSLVFTKEYIDFNFLRKTHFNALTQHRNAMF